MAKILEPGLTVKEVLDILFGEENENIEEVFMAPPDPNILTDEDSADEEEGGTPDNLSGKQLLADAEVRFRNGDEILPEPQVVHTPGTNNEQRRTQPLPTPPLDPRFPAQPYPQFTKTTEWLDGDFETFAKIFDVKDFPMQETTSAAQSFELFFDDEFIEFIVTESNRYALHKNCPDPNITAGEVRCFLAILILSGYNKLPSKRMYWEKSDDVQNKLVTNAMRRNRFELILRFIHFSNNGEFNPDTRDKLWKIRPLINHLKEKFAKYFVPEQNLSFDESMVRYYGKHGLKQFIRGKPIRFGYKVWSLNTVIGYLINFDIYQGRSVTIHPEAEKCFGKATAPLVQMIENLSPELKKLPFHFYFDNLFTSFNLLIFLREQGYGGTGTIRENRISSSNPLSRKKEMEKKREVKFALP